jgi:hypothetical protein
VELCVTNKKITQRQEREDTELHRAKTLKKKNSVNLCAFSVELCVTNKKITQRQEREDTELHRAETLKKKTQ